jgi:transcription initiation factor TFIIB
MDLACIWAQYELLKPSEPEACDDGEDLCKSCKSVLVEDFTSGIVVCMQCGLVSESDLMDMTPEWSMVNSDENKKDMARCGVAINPLLEKSSMSTLIKTNKYSFMKKIHNQLSMNYVERSRYHVFESITKMAGDTGNLPNVVIEQAKYYYKVMSERKLSRGVVRKGLIACCIVYACKTLNVPRSLKEISQITGVTVPVLNKTLKLFFEIMSDVLAKCDDNTDFMFEATECSDLIKRYIHNLKLSNKEVVRKLIHKVSHINELIKEDGLLECKTPSAITTGIIVYASNLLGVKEVTKNNVSSMFNVSIVTINKIVKIITQFMKEKTP